jgi:hypothetical protein
LHAAERDAGIQGGGDEGVPQRVGINRFRDSDLHGEAAHYPARAEPV